MNKHCYIRNRKQLSCREVFFFDIRKGIFHKSKLHIGKKDPYLYAKVLKKKKVTILIFGGGLYIKPLKMYDNDKQCVSIAS